MSKRFLEEEQYFTEIKNLIKTNKKAKAYIKNFCLFRLAFLKHIVDDPAYLDNLSKIIREINLSRDKKEILLPNSFERVRKMLIEMEKGDLEMVLSFFNSKKH